MPLPTPRLDDRRFQDIVDQAKLLIPHYCPEWTDHNVSDPGVTLIELFAWMTDMLLYRVNQVPDKLYVKFLELIGVHLESPRAARAPVTFYLSAAQPIEVVIAEGTEVATIQTETNPAIIFTTEADLIVRPATVVGALTRAAALPQGAPWITHDLRQLELPNHRVAIFPPQPAPGDAFYLAFDKDHSQHVLGLVLEVELAGGAGVDPTNPPLEWQVWQGGLNRWATCAIESDGTGGFNYSGEIILHIPTMAEAEFEGLRAYWLRCRLTDAQGSSGGYRVSPDVEQLRAEARGGTVGARHAITVHDEILGESDGTAGQTFRLQNTPVLARDPERDYLIVELPNELSVRWSEVPDFADSHENDRHFTLDNADGLITLGPSLLQPDGTVYNFGAVPVKGSRLRFHRYQHGGGTGGNVPQSALRILKTSIPYVARVENREPALGGRDAQTLDDAKLRTPQVLRTRTRAVTADDYEYLAGQVPGVARAHCLAPGAQPSDPVDLRPGQITVVVLPQVDSPLGYIPPDQLTLSAELRQRVLDDLDERRLLGTTLDVQPPQYTWVSVQAVLRVPERSSPLLISEVQQRALDELYTYLNPFVGGPSRTGWPFGRDLYLSEIFGLLQSIPYVEFVEDAQMRISEPGSSRDPVAAPPRLALGRSGIICSSQHLVTVR